MYSTSREHAGEPGAGIYILESNNVRVISNDIFDNLGGAGGMGRAVSHNGNGGIGTGIYIGFSTNCVITENKIFANKGGSGGHSRGHGGANYGGLGAGIYLTSSSNNTIGTNTINNSEGGVGGNSDGYGSPSPGGIGAGIYLYSASNNMIVANTLIGFKGATGGYYGGGTQFNSGAEGGKGAGIYLYLSLNNLLKGNNISKCKGGDGGGGYYAGPGWPGAGVGIYAYLSNNNVIENQSISDNNGGNVRSGGKGIGIWCDFSSLTIMETTIGTNSAYGTYGIYCTGSSSPTIGSTTIFNNLYGIYISSPANLIIHNSQIYNNLNYGIYNAGTPTIVDAKNNWWGNETGPNDTSTGPPDYNPYGTGDKISDYVAYRPWKGLRWITILPTSGTIGTIVTIQGVSYRATESVQIDFGNTLTIAIATTDALGNFNTIFEVNTQPYGLTTIKATGLSNQMYTEATFFIQPNIIFASPTTGTVGAMLTVKGNGFGASESIHILFGTTGTVSATVSDSLGRLATTFIVNSQPYGTTTIKVIGVNTQAEAMDYFFIHPSIILLTPCIGTVGSFVTVAGNGFGKMEAIRLDFGTSFNICMVSSTMDGTFITVFTIDTQPYGTTSIIATGLISVSKAFVLFRIVPRITVIPTSGQVGSLVTVAGNGFGVTELVVIEFGTTPTIALCTTNAFGEFQVAFTTDSQEIGTTIIVACGLMTNAYAMAHFIMLPPTTLKITPGLQNIGIGTEFISQVEIMDVQRMITAKIHLNFNPNILELQEIGSGTFPSGGMVVKKYDNITGEIDYFVGLLTGSATGSGILCTLKFKAKAGGTSAITFDFADDRITRLKDMDGNIPFNKEEALYRIITRIEVKPKDKVIKADERIDYQCLAHCGNLELDVTGSTTFTATGGGEFTLNNFLAKYMGVCTIQGNYLGFIGTTSVIVIPGTPTTLLYISGNNQVNTCTLTLKEPFVVKVVDKYSNPCNNVNVHWEIIEIPSGATGYSISATMTTTNIEGITASSFTLGTEPPGTYTIHASSTGLSNSPYIFIAHSLRRFGNIAGFCFLDFGTRLGTSSQIQVTIIQTGATTTTNESSYFIFETIPVGSYTLYFDTHGAAPEEVGGVCISQTQFENTTFIGTITLLTGDVNNDGKVNMEDWPGFVDAFFKQEGDIGWDEAQNADFNQDGRVDDEDFIIFRKNFGEGRSKVIQKTSILKPVSDKRIELSFDLETLEGVNINDLRIGNIIYLKVSISEAENFLGGEVHLSFNPNVLEVVNVPVPSPIMPASKMNMKRIPANEGIRIQPGDYPVNESYELINKVDNSAGKIDYAVGVFEPQTQDKGVLAIVPFRIKTSGASSKIEFNFVPEDNRETMFIERTQDVEEKPVDIRPDVSTDEMIINVPRVFNNFDSSFVYPNPVRKGNIVTFAELPNSKPIILKIFNITGELVREELKISNPTSITWDLRNKDNEYVTSGIYIYLLEYEGSTKKGKIGVIK